MWQALAEGCWSVTGVSFVSAVKGMKILPDVIPKNKNGLYWACLIPTGLFTSLLPIDAVFTQLSNYRQQRHSLFHVRSKGNFFTDLSIKAIGPNLFDVCWYKEYVSVEYRHPISYACCQYLTCLSSKLEQLRHWEVHDNWRDRQVGIAIRTFWRGRSSGMIHSVVWIVTDVLDELAASVVRI